jgi:fructose-1,6-bisphosphatase/sedoheptulose 1,7-bisphosphatase-like protein
MLCMRACSDVFVPLLTKQPTNMLRYMDKLAVGPEVDPAAVSLDKSVAENLNAVAAQLRKPVRCASPPTHYCRVLNQKARHVQL